MRAFRRPPLAWRSYAPARVSSALASVPCAELKPVVVGGTQGYADALGSGICYVSIDPMSTPGLVYRSYVFFGDGLLMVFNSYGDGEGIPNLTSAREFFFFPRRNAPELNMDQKAGTISVRMSDGGRADFDPAAAGLSGFERGAVTVAPKIDPASRGGVEIPRYAGLMLDSGFRLGESPSGRPGRVLDVPRRRGPDVCGQEQRPFRPRPTATIPSSSPTPALGLASTACPGLIAGF